MEALGLHNRILPYQGDWGASSPSDFVLFFATKSNNEIKPQESSGGKKDSGQKFGKRNFGTDTDTEMECSVCAGKYKNGWGLKIHQAKAGCGKQLPGSHRNTNKSEATSTPDSNHSTGNYTVRFVTLAINTIKIGT